MSRAEHTMRIGGKTYAVSGETYRHLQRDLRANRAGAKAFADACAGNDVEAFLRAVAFLSEETSDGWRLGMRRVARLSTISPEIRAAFLSVWIEAQRLPLRVGDRRVMTDALRVLMPGGYRGEAVLLYRGTSWRERRFRRYGFSWTRDQKNGATIRRGLGTGRRGCRFTDTRAGRCNPAHARS